ncbi:hypothetical protein MNBD_ALPHA06-2097 [hydrothermal vent metagenome]|uniref:DUF3108 domain-containing protein n=1 Tax=hydrothermal vent metagenome TaxID=652676 RepID=A0A3B0RXT3_9ZZZZ
MIRSRYLAIFFVLLAFPAQGQDVATAIHSDQERSVDITYGGRVFGIPVMKANISADFVGENYAARADFRTSGLLSIFSKIQVIASASGQVKNQKLQTKEYWHKELDGRKNRELSMSYGDELVTIRVDPPLYSMGDPPASMQQRLEALDPVSAILALAVTNVTDQQCNSTIKVFDGKQRYDLRMQAGEVKTIRTRAYKGKALRCQVWYVPVAGFDADDLANPEDYQKPVIMWLSKSKDSEFQIPVRFEAKLSFGTAVIEARKIEIKSAR